MKWVLALVWSATCLLVNTECLAVMSVDVGSEFIKVAIVKPGVPMEIVLNDESRRKTPTVVSMSNDERLFGEPALNVGIKKPRNAYWFTRDLLGKTADNPAVKLFQQNFPYYELSSDPETNLVVFKHDEDTTFTPEEIMAMILDKAKATAEKVAGQPIHDAVITVPVYFNQAERRAMHRAASLTGLKVLQLMNDNAAVALNYGVFRRKEFTNTSINFMFFDMGSSSTTASVVGYSVVKEKNKVTGVVESFPQLSVKGVGYDRSLGGLSFQLRLRDLLAEEFNKQKKTTMDVRTNLRSIQKLFKEAGRLMKVLSANSEHLSQVESLIEDIDFSAMIRRADFESRCSDLFDRLDEVIDDAMKSSEMTWSELSEVILMGGATRIPRVQAIIKATTTREELGKSINTDEAAALGAVYQAAHLSKGFKVLRFSVKEANIFPVQVEFQRVQDASQEVATVRDVRRVLFGRMNPFPQKKVMTFNKHTDDFDFVVKYGDLDFLTDAEQQMFGSRDLHRVSLRGVGEIYQKNIAEYESKGVKAHFRMDESGLVTLDKVESLFERTQVEDDEQTPAEEEESTLSKISSTISNLFGASKEGREEEKLEEDGKDEEVKAEETNDEEEERKAGEKDIAGSGGEDKPKQEDSQQGSGTKEGTEPEGTGEKSTKEGDTKEGSTDNSKTDSETEKPEEKTDRKTDKKTDEKPDDKTDQTDTKKNEKKSDEEKKAKKSKVVTLREEITSQIDVVDITDPSDSHVLTSRNKIENMKKRDEEKQHLERVKNEIESYIFEAQENLYQAVYEECSTEADREAIRTAMSEASDWLYDQDVLTPRSVYEGKLKDLQKVTRSLYERVKEAEERPRAMEALNSVVNYSAYFLAGMANFTGEDKPFTEVEVKTLANLLTATMEWNTTIQEEQAKLAPHEKPKLLVEDIARKISDIDREVKYLINKAKMFKPKPKPKEEKKSNTTKTTNATETASNQTTDGTESEEPSNQTKLPDEEIKDSTEKVQPGDGNDEIPKGRQPDDEL